MASAIIPGTVMTKGVMNFYGKKKVLNPESLRLERYFANGQKREGHYIKQKKYKLRTQKCDSSGR